MKKLLNIVLLLCVFSCYAHKDFVTTKTFGKITVHFVTGYQYEEINKSLIIGQYAESLAKSMGFKDSLFIEFHHFYTFTDPITNCRVRKEMGKNGKQYFLYYDKPGYDFVETLNILEAMFSNKLKKVTTDFASIEKKDPSDLVKQVLAEKVYRPDFVTALALKNISYYVRDGRYQIYSAAMGKETPLLSLDSLYQISDFENNAAVVFDTKGSFYFVSSGETNNVKSVFSSSKHYRPYKVAPFSKDCLVIAMPGFREEGNESIVYNYVSSIVVVKP